MANKRALVIDCQSSGIAGDKFLAALLDLGADERRVLKAMKMVQTCLDFCQELYIKVEDVKREGLKAKLVKVEAREDGKERKGKDLIDSLEKCLNATDISSKGREFAKAALKMLVDVEARVHGEAINDVLLHEIASVDTIVELLGVARAFDDLNLWDTKVLSLPVAVGGGIFKFSHGITSSPSFATLELFKLMGITMIGGPLEEELATPTGASILASLRPTPVSFYPAIRPVSIGYGAGTKELKGVPNVMRLVLGELIETPFKDKVMILETNVDDVSGELIGHVMNRLFELGVKDVSFSPIFTKKSRPAWLLRVISEEARLFDVCDLLFKELGTLGVRTMPSERIILNRRVEDVMIKVRSSEQKIRVKLATDPKGTLITVKPEHDDLVLLAKKLKMPLRELEEEVKNQLFEIYRR